MTLTLTQKGIGHNIQHMNRVYIERNRYLVALKDHEPDQWYQAIVKKTLKFESSKICVRNKCLDLDPDLHWFTDFFIIIIISYERSIV